MPRPHSLIDVRNATVWRGRTRVFADLSLKIEQGQNTAILGPNGAGKTTLLRLVTRHLYPVVAPDAYVRVLGRERWNVQELRSHIGVVSHDLQRDYLGFTLGRDVVLSAFSGSIGVHGITHSFTDEERERAERTMAVLGVGDLAEKPLAKMSTGEQRRFLLARALVNEPHTLVLDEPTAGLDLAAAFYYLEIVRSLIAGGVSIVLVTHHINEIPPEVTRVVLLKKGKVTVDGDKEQVLTERNLRALYDTKLRLVESGGFYVALPSEKDQSAQGSKGNT